MSAHRGPKEWKGLPDMGLPVTWRLWVLNLGAVHSAGGDGASAHPELPSMLCATSGGQAPEARALLWWPCSADTWGHQKHLGGKISERGRFS